MPTPPLIVGLEPGSKFVQGLDLPRRSRRQALGSQLEIAGLYLLEDRPDAGADLPPRQGLHAEVLIVTASHRDHPLVEIARADFEDQRNSLPRPLPPLRHRFSIAKIGQYAQRLALE